MALNYNQIMDRCKEKQGDKFTYPLLTPEWFVKNYKNRSTKILRKCSRCGFEKEVTLDSHFRKYGCSACIGNERLTWESFNQKIKTLEFKFSLNFDKEWFDKNYKNTKLKVSLNCNNCNNNIITSVDNLLNKKGCGFCSAQNKSDSASSTRTEFLNKVIPLYSKLDFSLVTQEFWDKNYIGRKRSTTVKLPIKCLDHGLFLSTASTLIQGHSCPRCYDSKGEIKIKETLEKLKISFFQEFQFKELPRKRFDFYIPSLNIAIEYDGELHYKSVKMFGGEENLRKTQIRDKIKTDFCIRNKIKLLRIHYTNFKKIPKIVKTIVG